MKRERPNPIGDTPIEHAMFLFKVMLDNYVDSMAFAVQFRKDAALESQFADDLQNDPEWFDKWSNRLSMGTNLTVYGVSAKTLLKEYTKEQLSQQYQPRLPEGEFDVGTDDPQLPNLAS